MKSYLLSNEFHSTKLYFLPLSLKMFLRFGWPSQYLSKTAFQEFFQKPLDLIALLAGRHL